MGIGAQESKDLESRTRFNGKSKSGKPQYYDDIESSKTDKESSGFGGTLFAIIILVFIISLFVE